MRADTVQLREAVLAKALASETRQEVALSVEEASAYRRNGDVIRGVGEQHLDHCGIAGRCQSKELADLVQDALGAGLDLLGLVDVPEERSGRRDKNATKVRIR